MKKNTILLIAILFLAGFLRFWQLDKVPRGLFGDEIDVGYQAYSLLTTGKDYIGQTLPLYIHSLSEWRTPLFIYATIPSIALLGLNELGVRGSAAFFGVLGVFLIFILGKKFKGENFGLISAFILAITPWHIHYSRAAFEVTLLLDLILAGTILLFGKLNKSRMILAAVLFSATTYTYSTAVLFTPMFVLIILWSIRNTLTRVRVVLFGITGILIIVPFFYMTILGPASGRFSLISVFSDDKIIDKINIERSETNKSIEKLFHNKIAGWGEVVGSNYVRAFSPEFLFVHGDPLPRHNVPGTGELYWGFLAFLLIGIFTLFTTKDRRFNLLLIAWILLAPLPSSLTSDGANHATRLFLMIPALVLIMAKGAEELLSKKNKFARIVLLASITLVAINTIFYFHRYYVHYNYQNWKYWNYGYKEAMQNVVNNQNKYKTVFINNTYQPSLLEYLFWSKYDPALFQKQFTGDVPKDSLLPNFNGFQLGNKLYFGETKDLSGVLKSGGIYFAAQEKEIPGDWDWSKTPPKDLHVLDVIHTPQGKPLFTVVAKE